MGKTEIVFVKNVADVDALIKSGMKPQQLAIALSFGAYHKLKIAGLNGLPVWDFINADEAKEQLTHHKTIIDDYWNPFFNLTAYKQYKIVPLYSLVLFLQEALMSSLVIRKILNVYKVETIVNYSSVKNLPCDEKNWHTSVFDSILIYIASQFNIPIKAINDRNQAKQEENTKHGLQKLKDTFQHAIYNMTGYILLPVFKSKMSNNGRINILSLLSEKEEIQRQKWFVDSLKQNPRIRFINIWKGKSKIFNIYSNGFLSRFLNKKRIQQDVSYLSDTFRIFRKEASVFPEIFHNNELEYQWHHLFSELVKNTVMARNKTKRFFSYARPAYSIISVATHPPSIAQALALKNQGFKTLLLSHSIMPEINRFYHDFYDKIIASTSFQGMVLKKMGINTEKIINTTDKRFHDIKPTENKEILKAKYGIGSNVVVTVITRNFQKGTGFFPKDEMKYHNLELQFKFILACVELQKTINNSRIIIKSHPGTDYYDLYNQLVSDNVIHIRKKPIDEIIQLSDIIIVVGAMTDAFFEAAMLNKKIIFCDCNLNNNIKKTIPDSIIVLNKPEELEASVNCTLSTKDAITTRKDILNSKLYSNNLNNGLKSLINYIQE
jgi:hypothetical protein